MSETKVLIFYPESWCENMKKCKFAPDTVLIAVTDEFDPKMSEYIEAEKSFEEYLETE